MIGHYAQYFSISDSRGSRCERLFRVQISRTACGRGGANFAPTRAGHSLPTSLTELREMWVRIEIISATGTVVFRSGGLDSSGDIEPGSMRFGALAGDRNGNVTYKPWEVTHFLWKRLIPAKASARDRFTVPLAAADAVISVR